MPTCVGVTNGGDCPFPIFRRIGDRSDCAIGVSRSGKGSSFRRQTAQRVRDGKDRAQADCRDEARDELFFVLSCRDICITTAQYIVAFYDFWLRTDSGGVTLRGPTFAFTKLCPDRAKLSFAMHP
jgi:hypothetical protein